MLVRQHWLFELCGNMDTSITIRTLTAINGQIYCSAGGGIVADSQEEAEYQETLIKLIRYYANWRSKTWNTVA